MRQQHRFKRHFRISLALHVVVLLFSHYFSFAQTYPISATLQLTPPYSVYLSDYTVNDQMKLHLLLRDLSEPSYQVRLSLVLEGVGIRIETNPNSVPPPITIEGGIPAVLSAEDLAPYLDTRNLIFSGISRQEYEQRAALPEGFYRFCFRVYDYKRKDVLLSQEACAQAWFMLNDPPRINTPLCGSTLPVRDPQNILFQWLPMNANSPNSAFTTEYEFTLVEIRPPGRNPNDAINVGYPLFQTTTQQTSLIYGLLEPPLIPGQEYAFRVRAIDTEERDQFKNRGYSEVCTFKFGDSAVPPPEGMNVYVEGERRAKVTWYTTLETDRYRVEYRKKSTGTGYTWFTIETTQDNALIQDLEPDTEYEVRVVGILKNQIGSYSPTKNFRTTPPRVYSCGQSVASMTPLNTNPLRNAMVGQIWKLDLFDMIVLDVSGSNGTFSGFGGVLVPFLGVKLYCQFENIKINEKQELIAGEVLSVKGDIEALKKRLVEINEQKKKDKAKSSGYVFEGVDIKFEGTIDSLYVNDAGEVIAVVASNENSTNGSSKKEERKIDIKKGADNRITDDSGNVYVVGKDGTIEKMGSTGASGTTAVASNVNYRVNFESSSNQAYGFDQQQHSEHERNYEKYERDGKVYTIPWKSVASGSRDVVIAKSTESRKDFLKEVIYKTDNGLLLRKPGNQENEVQLTVEGFGDQSTEQVTAYYKRKEADGKEKEVIAGKLNVVSYDKLVERLVIVSVNNTALNSSTTELSESLNTIFAPAAVEWTVESQSIDGINYDNNGKFGLDDGSSGLFSNYTGEMRTIINAYKDKYDIASRTWYLFLIPNSESGRTQGFMPRKKQAGFIFTEQLGEASLAKVIAHEIGHGAFRLEHSFDTYNTLAKYSTDNLMDYQPNGITLHKYQWDLIHDPTAVLGLFEGDEGGAMVAKDRSGTVLGYIISDGKAYIREDRSPYNLKEPKAVLDQGKEVEITSILVVDKTVKLKYKDESEKFVTSYSNLTKIIQLDKKEKYLVLSDFESIVLPYSGIKANNTIKKDTYVIADKSCGNFYQVNEKATDNKGWWVPKNILKRVGNDVADNFDWMENVTITNDIVSKEIIEMIKKNLEGINDKTNKDIYESNRLKIPKAEDGYIYIGNDVGTPSFNGTTKFEQEVQKEIYNEIAKEGTYASINTYDAEILTWGKGFSVGGQLMTVIEELFKSTEQDYKQIFLNVGIKVINGRFWVLDSKGNWLKDRNGFYEASIYIGKNTQLLSFLSEIAEKKNYAQDVINAQYKVLSLKAGKYPIYIFNLDKTAYSGNWSHESVTVLAHLSHWCGYSWSEGTDRYKDTNGDLDKIIYKYTLNSLIQYPVLRLETLEKSIYVWKPSFYLLTKLNDFGNPKSAGLKKLEATWNDHTLDLSFSNDKLKQKRALKKDTTKYIANIDCVLVKKDDQYVVITKNAETILYEEFKE